MTNEYNKFLSELNILAISEKNFQLAQFFLDHHNTTDERHDSLPQHFFLFSDKIRDIQVDLETKLFSEMMTELIKEYLIYTKISSEIIKVLKSDFQIDFCSQCKKPIFSDSRTFLSESNEIYHFGCYLNSDDQAYLARKAFNKALEKLTENHEEILINLNDFTIIKCKEFDQNDKFISNYYILLIKKTLSKLKISKKENIIEINKTIENNFRNYKYRYELECIQEITKKKELWDTLILDDFA